MNEDDSRTAFASREKKAMSVADVQHMTMISWLDLQPPTWREHSLGKARQEKCLSSNFADRLARSLWRQNIHTKGHCGQVENHTLPTH